MFRTPPRPASAATLMAWALGVWLASSAACFSPSYRDCQVTCAEGGHCPAPLRCQEGFCRTVGRVDRCSDVDAAAGQDADVADHVDVSDASDEAAIPDATDLSDASDEDALPDATDVSDASDEREESIDAPDAVNADGATEAAADLPRAPSPAIVATWFDTTTLMRPDLVSNADDGVTPGDGSDLVLGAVVVGPLDALVLVASTPSSADATAAWDTLVAPAQFPSAVSTKYRRGRETPILGVSMDGVSLANRLDGTLAPIAPGIHTLKLFANLRPPVFEAGARFTLAGLSGEAVFWGGDSVEPYWGGPSINSVSVSSDSLLVDVVGQDDATISPDSSPDVAFDIDVTGPFDTLLLKAQVSYCEDCESLEYIWDTLSGDRLFPQGVTTVPSYQHGRDTWILGIRDAAGTFINNSSDGSLPILVGHFSGRVFATIPPGDPAETRYSFQLVGVIGDTKVFGPWLALPP